MHGLIRVRQFTISEGHLMCTPEQLEEEFKGCLELTNYMLTTLGLIEDVSYRFSNGILTTEKVYRYRRTVGRGTRYNGENLERP